MEKRAIKAEGRLKLTEKRLDNANVRVQESATLLKDFEHEGTKRDAEADGAREQVKLEKSDLQDDIDAARDRAEKFDKRVAELQAELIKLRNTQSTDDEGAGTSTKPQMTLLEESQDETQFENPNKGITIVNNNVINNHSECASVSTKPQHGRHYAAIYDEPRIFQCLMCTHKRYRYTRRETLATHFDRKHNQTLPSKISQNYVPIDELKAMLF